METPRCLRQFRITLPTSMASGVGSGRGTHVNVPHRRSGAGRPGDVSYGRNTALISVVNY
ncbi:hypothetical protein GCM10010363_45270 [Streptomyces omiyaensis]|nr:hypothetical protein GCM10010363_45270 [Streptomyces omiyaensis]